MAGMTVTACLGADGNQFVFNSKQNLSSAAAAYNHMTKYVFGPDVVYDAPHNIFMEQKRYTVIPSEPSEIIEWVLTLANHTIDSLRLVLELKTSESMSL